MSKPAELLAEQTAAGTIRSSASHSIPRIIGVGASAGGLEALREMFRVLPSDLDLRIVVVQHLSPTHRSMLVSLLARESRLPVVEVVDGMEPRPNTIHITPPAYHIHLRQGLLRLVTARSAVGMRPGWCCPGPVTTAKPVSGGFMPPVAW
jgi:chemotaxis response regulator CheB